MPSLYFFRKSAGKRWQTLEKVRKNNLMGEEIGVDVGGCREMI
jgi:hypothetical protein